MGNIPKNYAGLLPRVLAFAADYLIIAVYLTLVSGVGFWVSANRPILSETLFGAPGRAQLIGFVLITLPVTLYFAYFESSPRQATWGKRRLGLEVTDLPGHRLTFGRALLRTTLKFIPWELAHTLIWRSAFATAESPILTIGLFMVWLLVMANGVAIWRFPTHQALYDQLTGTVVLKK